MTPRSIFLYLIASLLCTAGSAAAGDAPGDLAGLKANSWVKVAEAEKEALPFSATFYLPKAGEFFMWGTHARHRYEGKVYEVRTLSPGAKSSLWKESLPLGKEKSWAGGKFPNWGCGCHALKPTPGRTWLTKPWDRAVGGNGRINVVKFIETEGVLRPTRCYTYYQGAYDSKRDRVVYFAGGKTFAYDVKKRTWQDLEAKPPLCCDGLAFASVVYDPEGDRLILFGGAYALNPWGGARTWLFDCASGQWKKAKVAGGTEPPLRCNSQMVYDSKNKLVVMFGGDAQDRFLADTWVFDPAKLAWSERKPARCPPPRDRWSGCFVEKHGLVLLATPTRGHARRGRQGECWTYDAAANTWTPLKGRMPWAHRSEWLTCAYSQRDDVVLLHSPGIGTWLYKLDPRTAADPDPKRAAAKPGDWVWNSRATAQNPGLLAAPKPDRKATEEMLGKLPANQVVEAKYPGMLYSKTWSSATIDTDRGTVIYVGGGHCGYTGTDIARFDVGASRWTFDAPPCFIPFLYNYSAVLFGWDYKMRPQSQHTYRWYAYDPVSKMVVYCARRAGPHDGFSVQLREDEPAFVYDSKKHKQWTWVCDPAGKKFYPPVFGRPFNNSWEMALCTTPRGVFAKTRKGLYRANVSVTEKKADISWKLVDPGSPKRPKGYGGEFEPLVYDSKRKRLLYVFGPRHTGKQAAPLIVYEHPLGKGEWKLVKTKGGLKNSREVVYDPQNDCLISMPRESLLVMDCKTNEWKELDVQMPKAGYGVTCALLYDPVHKVCVMLIRQRPGRTGVYLFRLDLKTAKFRRLSGTTRRVAIAALPAALPSMTGGHSEMSTPGVELDLTPFLARGFGPEHDAQIANTPVRGIDRLLSYGKIRLVPETEAYLYGEYTPTELHYAPGTRPKLEAIAAEVLGSPPCTDRASVRKLLSWVPENVRHATGVADAPADRALPEEEIIASGWGWCNEQARVLVAVARTASIPGRLLGMYSSAAPTGHMTAELYVEGKWSWVCVTHDCVVTLPDGSWASAAEILFDPDVRAVFAAEWEGRVNTWNAIHGKPPLSGDPAADFGSVGIVNCPVYPW